MTAPPTLDKTTEEEALDALLERAAVYTDDWDPTKPDTIRTLLRIFSTFESDVRTRLNGVPQKHRIAFLDALGFERRPPKAARAPLTVHIPDDLDRNVVIPGGTQALSDSATDSQLFEIGHDRGFEATSATLTDVVAADPESDSIVDHSAVVDGEPTELFTGSDIQQHHLYVASEQTLNLNSGSSFSVTARLDVDNERFAEAVVWEYYGKDESGSEGWHRLAPPRTEQDISDESGIKAVKQKLQQRHDGDDTQAAETSAVSDETAYEATFELRGEITEHTVNGVTSRWLRCRLTDDSDIVSTSMRDLSVHAGQIEEANGLDPDFMLSNDVPLSAGDGHLKPLGEMPQPPAAFYVACEEAFTKPGGTVTLEFSPADADTEAVTDTDEMADAVEQATETQRRTDVGVLGGEPRLSWEYWNGNGWVQLNDVSDETDTLNQAGTVTFPVPEDSDLTTVSGHENVWIRARLVSGNYGQPALNIPEVDGFDGPDGDLDPPVFGDVTIQYEHSGQQFETVFRHNSASFSEDLTDRTRAYKPFKELPESEQTVYLGFDNALHDGPITLFVPVEDTTYPQSFDPGMEWEYCRSPTEFRWSELDVRDRTAGFTERGIVSLTFPEETTAFDLFGRRRHWIRVRASQDEFERLDEEQSPETAMTETAVDQSTRTTAPPVVEGIYPNTRWAYNKRTVKSEILGSSDGSHDQSFRCAHAPMMSIDVWVDEASTLSAGEQRTLLDERPDDVDREFDERGDLSAFWVRWQSVEDFLDSSPNDRHYVVNKTLGTVEFGDGDAGSIPPNGQDNVRATYTTGGGSDGNVDAATITELKTSISLVDDISNPEPADGGADVESVDALVSRSANQLKHRGKAVTPSDYEEVALSAFRELSTVKCETTAEDGETRVTVIIVPETERDKPVPSIALKHQVRDALIDCAPATVVESSAMDIVVRGPGYAEISVEATIRAPKVKSVSLLKQRIRRKLDSYLHPLSGRDGSGWEFGELPDPEALVAQIDDIDGVETPLDVTMYVETNGTRRAMTGRLADTGLPPNTLVCSGSHRLSVTMEMED